MWSGTFRLLAFDGVSTVVVDGLLYQSGLLWRMKVRATSADLPVRSGYNEKTARK
jgi:hypothetical protein